MPFRLERGSWIFEPPKDSFASGDTLRFVVYGDILRGYVNNVLIEERLMTPEEYFACH